VFNILFQHSEKKIIKLRASEVKLLFEAIKLRDSGYKPRWVGNAVIPIIAYLLKTAARRRS